MKKENIISKLKWHLKRKTKIVLYFFGTLLLKQKIINKIKIPLSQKYSFQMKDEIFKGTYEQNEIETISENLKQNDIVLELGTCIGYVSAYCAKKIGSEKIFTFEANKNMSFFIDKLYLLNNIKPNVNYCILSDKNTNVDFYYEPNNYFASSLFKLSKTSIKTNVEMFDINLELEKNKANFLIIDIEGGEYDLFKHLNLQKINKIAVEFHRNILGNEKIDEIISIILHNNFIENKCINNMFYYFEKNN